jgi:hypothetical protein
MFDDDGIRLPQFATYFFESLVQLPWPSLLPISGKIGPHPPFSAFEPEDADVNTFLTLPEYVLSIPYVHHPSVYPFPLVVNQQLEVALHPSLEADDPLLLSEEAVFVGVHIDLTLAQDLICLDNDVPEMIRAYTMKAEQSFQSILMPGAPVRVSMQVTESCFPKYIQVEQLSLHMPCCISASMMADTTFVALMGAVKPWVNKFYIAEINLLQFIALTLWLERMQSQDSSISGLITRMMLRQEVE